MQRFDTSMDAHGAAFALAAPAFAPAEIDRTAEVGDLWRILARRRAWILWTALLAVGGALTYGLLTPALYTATAQILIDPRDRQVLTNDINPVAVAPDGGVTQVESQARVIESASVLQRAIAATDLTHDPEFGGRGWVADATALAKSLVGLGEPEATRDDGEERTLRALKRRLSIKRADKVFVIDIVVTAKTADNAACIANAIAAAYLADGADARVQASRRAFDALAAKLEEQRERVRKAENQVESYKAANDLVRSSGTLVTEQQLSEINLQLSTARTRTAALKARIDQIDDLRRTGLGAEATAEAIQSTVVAKLRAQYAELVERQADLSTQLGARHPSIVSVTAQLQQVRDLIAAELVRIGRSARADYDRALANERSLAASFARLKTETNGSGQASVRLRELEREVEASRAVYTAFLTRSREIREQSGIDATNARIISRAIPPQEKSWPLPGLFALCAFAAGVGLGTGLAVVAEYAAPTVLSRGQLQRIAHAQVVGVIAGPGTTRGRSQAAGAANAGLILGRLLAAPGLPVRAARSILVTSGSRDDDGRRRTAQLLVAAAEARGLRVLFVDTEPRGGGSTPGLLDVLRGDQALGPLLRPRRPGELQILGIGRDGRGELVGALDVRARFLSEVEQRFDLVVIDGGALAENPQAAPIVALSDVVLLVATAGVTGQGEVIEASEAAALAGRPISAALLLETAGA